MENLKQMTVAQLKQFLSENRNNDEIFSEALGELMSRNPNRKRYAAEMSIEEIGQVISERIQQSKKQQLE